MKKIIILLIILMCISLQATGCSKDKTGNSINEGQAEETITNEQKNNILRIAYQSLSEVDKNTVINWSDGNAIEYNTAKDHLIASKDGSINIKDRDTYRVVFSTNTTTLGPIVIYIDKNSYSFLGFDIRN